MSCHHHGMATIGSDNSIDLSNIAAFHEPEFLFINKLFQKHGFEVRVAGGAVRDILMQLNPKDIDLATTATPSQMVEMFTKEQLRMLNRNGESHGTVTIRLNDKVNYEITTLRIDLNPDGRHSDVTFTTDWQLDASRRDLTVNSMFIGVEFDDLEADSHGAAPSASIRGKLYDYFNGFEDLSHRRIRFVGDPKARIQEDYLRILRYFRFHARLSNSPDDHDEATLKAITETSSGLWGIAGERIWIELKQIFCYPSVPLLLRYMAKTGVTQACGLPASPNYAELEKVFERGLLRHDPNPVTCVAAALHSTDEVDTLFDRIRPSNLESNIVYFLVEWREHLASTDALEFLKREYLLSMDQARLKPVFDEAMRYFGDAAGEALASWLAWQAPRFPVNGTLVSERWGIKGRLLRSLLQGLRTAWVDSGCSLTADELLSSEMHQKLASAQPDDLQRSPLIPLKRQRR
ncbi:unnamed protein product [Mesocestoides corti]|nr:unnamed protein product [Mesocestoides corti]